MSGSLGFNINDLMGEAFFPNGEVTDYWQNEMKEKPMISTGPEVDLKMYVWLRAIQELQTS
ncbi:MAG: hypothetical protein NTW79_02530 [Candidatus Berkelbacteria bacterium]|nr:hypothetical protein [Candidatus Berkelbacteria bacterium]